MAHYLIVQVHEEDLTVQTDLVEADTWQVALGMVGLGWAIESNSGIVTIEAAKAELRSQGTVVQLGIVESYQSYDHKTKIQLKEAA